MKRNLILIFILLLSFVIIVSTSLEGNRKLGIAYPQPHAGVLDLSNWDFEKRGSVPLTGEWAFYFNQFLTKKDFDLGLAGKPAFITIPANKSTFGKVKPFETNKFYGTLRLKIKLPETHQIYNLKSNIVLTSYKLFMDDVLKSEVGQLGKSAETSVGSYKMSYVDFNPTSREVELIYQTADFTKGDCAIAPPELGLAKAMNEATRIAYGRDLFLFGMLLIMGIYHLGLFAMRNKEPAPFYFSMFCLSFALRLLFVGERVLYSIIDMPLPLVSKICYACAFGGICAFFMFIYHAVDDLFPKWYLQVSQLLAIVSLLIVILLPPVVFESYLMLFAVLVSGLQIYTIFKLIQGVRQGYEFSELVLAGTLFLGVALINDLVYHYTLINRASMIPVGVFVFTLTQSLTLSSKFSKAFSTSENLTIENEKIMKALKYANANLETRVLERTEDLQKAIVELDQMSKTDYLTKLPNRRLMFEHMDALVAEDKDFYIALGDIDKFKLINDTYGHDCGDKVLMALSEALCEIVGDNGIVGRWGGEEFLIILMMNDRDSAETMAKMICEKIQSLSYRHIQYPQIKTTVTLGLYPYKGIQSLDMCIACADEALYKGKANGRNQFVMYQVEQAE